MKSRIFSFFALAIALASCSTAYRQAQTPDDVYYSPGIQKERTYASAEDNRRTDNYARRNNGDYDEYTSSSDDRYLRMKIQDRYRWGAIDDNDYWSNPGYVFNNYYGYNSFNPFSYNSWGLSYYYSPFTSIQPYGWFNSYYPTYGYYSPYSSYYGHSYSYGYTPVFLTTARNTAGVHRPMLGSYNNAAGYNNSNNRSRTTGRYVPGFNTTGDRYNNRNNNNSFSNNNNNSNRSNNNNSNSAPTRSFTPSSSSSSSSSSRGSSGGGGVSRQPR